MTKEKQKTLSGVRSYLLDSYKKKIVSGESLPPMVYALCFEGKSSIKVVEIPLNEGYNSVERSMIVKEVALEMASMKGMKVEMFVSIFEGWGGYKDKKKKLSDKEREEFFIVDSIDSQKSYATNLFKIVRDQSGTKVEEVKVDQAEHVNNILNSAWDGYLSKKQPVLK